MIFDWLYLAFALGSESAERKTAEMKAKQMLNDAELMRKEFFAKSRKYKEDLFMLFGKPDDRGKDHQWHEAMEKLDLLQDGYFPYSIMMEYPITDEVLEKYKLKNFQYKLVPTASEKYVDIYLKLTDVEQYIALRNSTYHYRPSIYEEIPLEVRNLFHEGKVTIGIPFAQADSTPCQVKTISEAKEFMSTIMENRFQKYWTRMRK